MSSFERDIAYLHEESPLFPSSHKRHVFEFIGRDEVTRRRIEIGMLQEGVEVTSTPCNGKFHGTRTLISMWDYKYEELKGKYKYLCDATIPIPIDGREYNETPSETEFPLAVVKYMREGRIHFSQSELKSHCSVSFSAVTDIKNLAQIDNSTRRVNAEEGSTIILWDRAEDSSVILTSTVGGWLKFCSDFRCLSVATGIQNPLYDYIREFISGITCSSQKSISLPKDFEPDNPWR